MVIREPLWSKRPFVFLASSRAAIPIFSRSRRRSSTPPLQARVCDFALASPSRAQIFAAIRRSKIPPSHQKNIPNLFHTKPLTAAMAQEKEIPFDQWATSDVKESNLKEMEDLGVLAPKALLNWRPACGEEYPTPNTGEVVVFTHFFFSGFDLPTSDFFRGLLHFYGSNFIT